MKMLRGTQSDAPVESLHGSVREFIGKLREIGLEPNRRISFCSDAGECADSGCRGWLISDPRRSGERWLLLEDGDVWHEVESGQQIRSPRAMPAESTRYEWLDRPTSTLQLVLKHSLFNARLGGTGFLVDEERFARRPYLVGDRRAGRGGYSGFERRQVL